MPAMELRIESLNKRYRDVWATRDLSLTLEPGILGLLGPNGAGKSTLMRMIATVTKPTSGTIWFDGVDTRKNSDPLRKVLGYLPQDFGIYPHLNAVEFLEYMAALKGLSRREARTRIDYLLEMLNLGHARRRALGGFSGGMRQRVGIAQALLNDPKLLIVDEPTTGLDPEERVRFKHLLTDLSGERIIILSTHICSDVESIAHKVAIVAQGQLLALSTPGALVARGGSLESAYLGVVGGKLAA
jgi:ABC-type multidrug transport system ATPase subunit